MSIYINIYANAIDVRSASSGDVGGVRLNGNRVKLVVRQDIRV